MKYFDILNRIQSTLQQVNGFEHDLLVTDFLAPSGGQNSLIVKEGSDEAEILVCLDEKLLKRCSDLRLPHDFDRQKLSDLSILVEELSHFNTLCESLLANREVSALELEVQGEVDKFAAVLSWLEERNEETLQHDFFEALFGQCELGAWVKPEERERYLEAHSIARNFCRHLLKRDLSWVDRKREFKRFFNSPRSVKLNPSAH